MSKPPAQHATASASRTASQSRLPRTPIQAPAGAMASAHPSIRFAAQVNRFVYGQAMR